MPGSVYKIIEVVGTSTVSWEDAARKVIETTASTVRDVRVAEVVAQDLSIEDGQKIKYRVKLHISFKYHQQGLPWPR